LRRKRNSSIAVAIRLAHTGQVDAVVTAGNSGAAAAAAKLEWRLLPGVDRPAIAALVPGPLGATVLIDAGATVNCKALHLVQFAHMGACYARAVLNRAHPVVGLLSVGEEDAKGTQVTRDAFRLLRESHLHFYGNVEGQDVFSGKVDVIVCDGFVGNVALKVMEGMAGGIRLMIERNGAPQGWLKSVQRLMLQPIIGGINRQFDLTRFGGAPLLGVSGVCICAHGNSRAAAVSSAIERAREAVDQRLNERITEAVAVS
jgi:glycerol-3-phosphate acyltransferase PlsX